MQTRLYKLINKMEEELIVDFNYTFHYFSTTGVRSHVQLEHTYYNPHPEKDGLKPTKYLLCQNKRESKTPVENGVTDVENRSIDVENVENQIPLFFSSVRKCDAPEIEFTSHDEKDWVEKIDRKGWNMTKSQLFKNVEGVLEADYLARMSSVGLPNEIVRKRLMTNKTAIRLRRIFTSVSWNVQLLQWLHCLLLDNLPKNYFSSYQDALQCLETKVQSHLIENITSVGRMRNINAESHNFSNKKTWDPFLPALNNSKLEKLPGGPLLVMVPSNTGGGFTAKSRPHRWMTEFSYLSTLITVTCPKSNAPSANLDVAVLLDQMISATRAKIMELKSDYPSKPIVLIGLDSGSSIACHVALLEKVSAVICLGFSLFTMNGKRGFPQDKLINLQAPTLFVIGQNATTSTIEGMEELRIQLHCYSSLVVVGGADDQLRVSHELKMRKSVTQSIVDRCILNEVGSFLYNILTSPIQPTRHHLAMASVNSDPKTKHVEKNSLTSAKQLKKAGLNTIKKPRIIPKKAHLANKELRDAREETPVIVSTSEANVNSSNTSEFLSAANKTTFKADPNIFSTFENTNHSWLQQQTKQYQQTQQQQTQPHQTQQRPQPQQQNLYTNMEFDAPSENIVGLKKILQSNESHLSNHPNFASFNQISIRNGSVSIKSSDLTISHVEGQLTNLSSFLTSSKNVYEPFRNVKVFATRVAAGSRGRRKAPKQKDIDGVRVRRPYVRRNPLQKRESNKMIKMPQLPPITSQTIKPSLSPTSPQLVNISADLITEEVELITVSNSTMTSSTNANSSISSLTADSILDLPVVFADDN